MKSTLLLTTTLLISVTIFSSCKSKEEHPPLDTNNTTNNSLAEYAKAQQEKIDALDRARDDIIKRTNENMKDPQGYEPQRPESVSKADYDRDITPILNNYAKKEYNLLVDNVEELEMGMVHLLPYDAEKVGYYLYSLKSIFSTFGGLLQLPETTIQKVKLKSKNLTEIGVIIRQKMNRLIALESTLNTKLIKYCIENTCQDYEHIMLAGSDLNDSIKEIAKLYTIADRAIDAGYPDESVAAGNSILNNLDKTIKVSEDKLESSNDNFKRDLDDVLNLVNEGIKNNSIIVQ